MIKDRVLFCDLHGLPRGKYIPAVTSGKESQKVGFAQGAFSVSLDRDLLTVPGTNILEGIPDMELVLEEEEHKSWQPNTRIRLGNLYAKNAPYGLCGRGRLEETVKELAKLDLAPMIGIELEAYAFERDDDGTWRPYNTPGALVYGTGPSNDPKGLLDQIFSTAYECNLPVESLNGEYDNGQFELTLCFDNAMKACDSTFLFKLMAREVAFKNDLLLTFLPKPIPERGGSGFHVNMSLRNSSGKNIISEDGKLSDISKYFMAGLMKHHESLSSFLAPTVNSYERLAPASMAGYWANWAEDHRLVTLRTSTKSEKSARLEHRTGDCSCNPYLAVTALLQAGILGIENKFSLQDPEDLDGLENVRATRHVPSNLLNALDALEKDAELCGKVGDLISKAHIFLKRDEAKRLEGKNLDEIRDYYLPFI